MTTRMPKSLGPLAAQSREDPVPYSLPAENDSKNSVRLVLHGSIVDRHLLTAREVLRHASFDTWDELILDPDVGKGTPHHDLMVAAASAIGIEVLGLHSQLDQVLPCWSGFANRARWRDVICGDRIAKNGQHSRTGNICAQLQVASRSLQRREAP